MSHMCHFINFVLKTTATIYCRKYYTNFYSLVRIISLTSCYPVIPWPFAKPPLYLTLKTLVKTPHSQANNWGQILNADFA